jgi:hypothetical protein
VSSPAKAAIQYAALLDLITIASGILVTRFAVTTLQMWG